MKYNTINLSYLLSRFYIEDGKLKNKIGGRGKHIGSVAGSINKHGYIRVRITTEKDSKNYMVHRLIYQMCNNLEILDPSCIIDHIDGNRSNNVIENLRMCTRSENNSNLSVIRKDNTSGHSNIYIAGDKFDVIFSFNKKNYYVGRFDDLDEAIKNRNDSITKIHGEFTKLEIKKLIR